MTVSPASWSDNFTLVLWSMITFFAFPFVIIIDDIEEKLLLNLILFFFCCGSFEVIVYLKIPLRNIGFVRFIFKIFYLFQSNFFIHKFVISLRSCSVKFSRG